MLKKCWKQCNWVIAFCASFSVLLLGIAALVYQVDPMLHFHAPNTDQYYYELGSQFESNDGVVRNLDYDSIIVGTSMSLNFSTSQAEKIFGGSFVKAGINGATFQEVNDTLQQVYAQKETVRTVIRDLETEMLNWPESAYRDHLKYYEDYVKNTSFYGDLMYFLNRNILYEHSASMLVKHLYGMPGGIISMDAYGAWSQKFSYSAAVVLKNRAAPFSAPESAHDLSAEEQEKLQAYITENLVASVAAHPDTEFYMFFPPHSAAWWGNILEKGELRRELQEERLLMELLLPFPNVHLFGWSTVKEITFDLNNYKDTGHYGPWVNYWMMEQMQKGYGLLTEKNYQDYLKNEYEVFANYDYNLLFEQKDLEGDTISDFFVNRQLE